MKTTLTKTCEVKALVWDNESVLVAPDWKRCYDIAYEKLGIKAPLAGDPSRGKHFKKMLSVPITPDIDRQLNTFVQGPEEDNYLQSYTSSRINSEEFWPIACQYGFELEPTSENVAAICTAQTYLIKNLDGQIMDIPKVVEVLKSAAEVLPQYMLSNTNPEIYEGIKDADFLKFIPEKNRLFSIFIQCRKPSAESFESLIERAACEPQKILFIDDKDLNIEVGRNHGISGIVFNGQTEPVENLIHHLEDFGIIISE